jgi:hypothetical protein
VTVLLARVAGTVVGTTARDATVFLARVAGTVIRTAAGRALVVRDGRCVAAAVFATVFAAILATVLLAAVTGAIVGALTGALEQIVIAGHGAGARCRTRRGGGRDHAGAAVFTPIFAAVFLTHMPGAIV